ncbi:MAG: SRPBCC family protein [Marmoricola sp.]
MIKHVDFDVEPVIAFDFLVDPANRPLWQSSLRRVEDVSPADPVVGQTWTDVTSPGLRPAMETTELVPSERWTERGTWRGVTAQLTLTFEPDGDGCRVLADATVTGPLIGRVLTTLAPYAIRGDLERAARILSERASGQ